MEIDGTLALVTGAAGAIGSATARKLAANGARLILADRDEQRLVAVAEELGELSDIEVTTVIGDVSNEAHHRELLAAADGLGGVDIVVLNAGVYLPGLLWELPLEQWELQVNVNFWGVLHGLRTTLPGMIDRSRGHVVAVSSGAGILATPGIAPYVATKHAVVGMMESLRHELNRVCPDVGASVVCPGNVRSDMATNSLTVADISDERLSPVTASLASQIRAGVDSGTEPAVVAEAIVDAIIANKFWVLPHPELGWVAVDRMERLRNGDEPADLLG